MTTRLGKACGKLQRQGTAAVALQAAGNHAACCKLNHCAECNVNQQLEVKLTAPPVLPLSRFKTLGDGHC
jgi:hypothetical protein